MRNLEDIKIKLVSDFTDYYDMAFDNPATVKHYVLYRMSENSLGKEDQFKILKALGHDVIDYGRGYPPQHTKDQKFVLYTNEHKHRGEGKKLLTYDKLCKVLSKSNNPNHLWSRYIAPDYLTKYKPESLRFLFIGNRMVKLTYTQLGNDWRSNNGTTEEGVEVKILGCWPILNLYLPLYAIDFVDGLAIDLNTAPGLSPLEGVFTPTEIIDLMKEWFITQDKYKDQFLRYQGMMY